MSVNSSTVALLDQEEDNRAMTSSIKSNEQRFGPAALSEEEWRKRLSPEEYDVLRQAGTEPPGSGALLHENRSGAYHCKACGARLFDSSTKFDAHCGWPSFYEAQNSDAVTLKEDSTLGMVRTEVRCASCDSHLGHVFPDAPQTPTGDRYCMNSLALDFQPQS